MKLSIKKAKGCFGGTLPGEKKMAKKREIKDGKPSEIRVMVTATEAIKGTAGHKLYRKMGRANGRVIRRRLNILKSRDQKWLKARMEKKEAEKKAGERI